MKYTIEHQGIEVAEVEITEAKKAREPIKEMVEFWAMWETALAKAGGDYTRAWLTQLAHHILHSGHPPRRDDEGWVPLDGSHGIKLLSWDRWEFDPSDTVILPND